MSSKARTILIEIPSELERVFPLVKMRRPHLDQNEFTRLALLAQAADGYRLVAREFGGRLVALMGYRILHDLAHGSHLYVDDLVAESSTNVSEELGQLLRFAESEARRLGLSGLRLTADGEDAKARRFYEDEGWDGRAATYKKPVASH